VHIAAGHDRDDVWLAVSDTCGGIPDDDLGGVFDVAFRGERARTPFRRRRRARARVSSDTPGAPLSTRETVALDTPASEATSAMFSRPSSAPTGRESKGAQPVTY
jgi:hypothetical protein